MQVRDIFSVTSTRPVDPDFYSRSPWRSRPFLEITGMLVMLIIISVVLIVGRGRHFPLIANISVGLAPWTVVLVWARTLVEHHRLNRSPVDPHRADAAIRSMWVMIWTIFFVYTTILVTTIR